MVRSLSNVFCSFMEMDSTVLIHRLVFSRIVEVSLTSFKQDPINEKSTDYPFLRYGAVMSSICFYAVTSVYLSWLIL